MHGGLGRVTGAVALAMASVGATAAPQPAADAAIKAVLDDSAAAWNAGDLDRFMACYEREATTSYVSGTRFVQGYDAIRAMYGERFGGGSRSAMGRLSLDMLDLRRLGPDHAYVVGRFHLHRTAAAGGDVSGLTTLVFHRSRSGWRIVADHS